VKRSSFKISTKFLYFSGALAIFLGLPAISFLRSVSDRNTAMLDLSPGRKMASIGPVVNGDLANETLASAPSVFNEKEIESQLEAELQDEKNAFSTTSKGAEAKGPSLEELNRNSQNSLKKNYGIQFDVACKPDSPMGGGKVLNKGVLDSSFLQISGKNCLNKSPIAASSELLITNTTNGFTATVFNKSSSGHEYQTDLIQLNEGENLIQISYTTEDGHKRSFNLSVQSETQRPTVR